MELLIWNKVASTDELFSRGRQGESMFMLQGHETFGECRNVR